MFRVLDSVNNDRVTVSIDGVKHQVPVGISAAAAVFQCGLLQVRTTPVSAAPRAPYCMMGVCFDCLMEIDGIPNQQACQIIVEEGMQLVSQNGAAALGNTL